MKSINFIYHEFTFTHSFSVQDDSGVRSVSGWFHFSFQTLITEEITQKTFNYHLHCTVNVRTEVIYFVISVYSSRNVSSEPIQF